MLQSFPELVCPRDKLSLQPRGDSLLCANGHRYAVIEDIPILLLSETPQTHIEGTRALALAEGKEPINLPQFNVGADEVDPFVKNAIAATNGSLYSHLVGNLTEYPIPALDLPDGAGKLFLEIGCNWGRWCIAAARLGYKAVGIDPSLKAVRAARRIARQLKIEALYVVGDGRHLPFGDEVFDQVFSYSVLQHLSKENVGVILQEIRRVLAPGGAWRVQMPNVFGLRCMYHQLRRGFRDPQDFDVRYWTARELRSAFGSALGLSQISVDGFFSLNPQASDLRFMPAKYRALIHTSEYLRKLSASIPALRLVADSLYICNSPGSLGEQPNNGLI